MTRKRRGRGEGSVYQRADGRWVGSVSAGRYATGKRRRRTVYGNTKKEVLAKIAEVKNEIVGPLPSPQRITVADYLKSWLVQIGRSVSAKTLSGYRQTVEDHLIPMIGHLPLRTLHPLQIEAMYAAMEKAKTGARTIQKSGTVLGGAIRDAIPLGLIASNPVYVVRKPRVPKYRFKTWTAGEMQKFLEYVEGDRYEAFYVLALAAGMRSGELIGLELADIDFAASTVTVRRAISEVEGEQIVVPPKYGSARTIVLPPQAVASLAEHRRKQLAEGLIDRPFFCTRTGRWRTQSDASRAFRRRCTKAGVPLIRLHDLRHTHATLLLQAGENPKVVSERLGHTSVKITLDTYGHVMPSMQRAAADKFAGMMGGGA